MSMTEKRYYCNENFVVIDSKTEKSCSYFKCMNLLNEKEKEIKGLEEENEQLKEVVREFIQNSTQHNLWKLRTVLKDSDLE